MVVSVLCRNRLQTRVRMCLAANPRLRPKVIALFSSCRWFSLSLEIYKVAEHKPGLMFATYDRMKLLHDYYMLTLKEQDKKMPPQDLIVKCVNASKKAKVMAKVNETMGHAP